MKKKEIRAGEDMGGNQNRREEEEGGDGKEDQRREEEDGRRVERRGEERRGERTKERWKDRGTNIFNSLWCHLLLSSRQKACQLEVREEAISSHAFSCSIYTCRERHSYYVPRGTRLWCAPFTSVSMGVYGQYLPV